MEMWLTCRVGEGVGTYKSSLAEEEKSLHYGSRQLVGVAVMEWPCKMMEATTLKLTSSKS